MSVALLFHLLAVVIWVGGMFFALAALRPAAAALEPPQRLTLLAAALARFFMWVTIAIVVILATGFYLIAAMGGFRTAGVHVHAMMTLGIVMMLIFGHVRAVSYRRLQAAVATQSWPAAGAAMASIRTLVSINLVLGVLTIAVAVIGRRL